MLQRKQTLYLLGVVALMAAMLVMRLTTLQTTTAEAGNTTTTIAHHGDCGSCESATNCDNKTGEHHHNHTACDSTKTADCDKKCDSLAVANCEKHVACDSTKTANCDKKCDSVAVANCEKHTACDSTKTANCDKHQSCDSTTNKNYHNHSTASPTTSGDNMANLPLTPQKMTTETVMDTWGISVDGEKQVSLIYLTILVIAAAALAFFTIFLYRKRQLQLRLSMVLNVIIFGICVYVGIYVFKMYQIADSQPLAAISYSLSCLFPLLALLMGWLASKGITKDIALLKSLNRIR